jgi:hypothetical protein
MAVGVGASGFVGIAPETVSGTYVAPTKYLVLRNESLKHVQETNWRRPLRGIADISGVVAGYFRTEGSITVEVTEDTLCHLLRAARYTGVKTGSGPYVYTFTPSAVAIPTKTLSFTVVRNGVTFGFVGCVLGSAKYSVDNGLLIATFDVFGRSEASQTLPTPTHVTTLPFGAGQYTLEIPAASAVIDADVYELSVNDSASHEYRFTPTAAAAFARFGERNVELTINRDFDTRTDYDAFKALSAQSIKFAASKGANASVIFEVFAALKDTYEIVGMSGQAELIRANIKYRGVYSDGDAASHKITVTTTESIASFP